MAAGTAMAIGAVLSAIVSAYGLYKQDQENQAARSEARDIYGQQSAEERRKFQANLGLQQAQLGLQRQQTREASAERRRQWKWNEENRDYQRAMDFQRNFINLLQQQPALQNNLINAWRR